MPNDEKNGVALNITDADVTPDTGAPLNITDADVTPDPVYRLTQADRKRIAEGFRDDPLAFIADPDERGYCRRITDTMKDPEDMRKRMALAAHFTRHNPGVEYNFVFANLDSILEKHYNKKVTVTQAWKDFHDMYHPAEATALGELPGVAAHMFTAMGAGLGKTGLNILNTVLKFAAQPGMEERAVRMMALTPEQRQAAEKADRDFAAGLDNLAKPWRKALTEVQEEHTRAVLPENWFTNFNSEWGNNALMFLALQAPQQAAQLTMAYTMGPAAFCMAIGGSSAIDKWYELEDNPDMTEQQKYLNAAFTGFINSGSAWITAGVVKGKIPALNRETIARGARGAIGYFAKAFGVEASQEATEQLAENITDIYTGVHGDPGKMDPGTYWKHFWNGVGESALAGGVFGMTAAGLGFKSWHDRMAAAERAKQTAEATVATLEKKEKLTSEETRKLTAAKTVAAQNDPGKVLAADALAKFIEENDSDEEIRKSARFRELREAAAPEVPDETVIEACRSERSGEVAKALPHDVQDTYDAALELMDKFPQFQLQVYDSIDSVPEEVKKAMEEQTETPSLVRAWTDDAGTVHLIGDRVRPDEAARVIGHEIIGHHGLRAVFGDQFDTFLDDVYNLHSSEIDGYAERYQADPESDAGRRYLTEEFLADCADARVKPSWWKEFLARCRAFLDRVVGRHHFSDLDIEAALSRSARAVRKKRGLAFERGNDGVRFSLFDNQRKSSLVIDALKKIAAGEEEVTVAKLRDDLEQYGGTNDISFGWGNEKKGIYHIAYRRGINTLFHVIDAVSDGRILRYTAGNKTVVLEKDGYEAVLALTEFGKRKSWLLSGWKKNEPDAVGEVGTQSNATQSTPTFSRHELGAGLESIIAQNGENASPGTGKNEENLDNTTPNSGKLRKNPDGTVMIPREKLSMFAKYAGVLRMPPEIALELCAWDNVFPSPYSFSFYDMPGKTWDNTPEGILRIADHWNFESQGKTHCVTDVPVKKYDTWTIAQYQDGVYHVILSLPKLKLEAAKAIFYKLEKPEAGDYAVDPKTNAIKETSGLGAGSTGNTGNTAEADGTGKVRFSVAPGNENLVVLHNLSAAKLRRAVKLGGLPVPSLAIVDAEKSDFTNFGEISLVADKNLIDPKHGKNKVFNADIYSPRAPETKKFYSDADYDQAAKALKPYDLAADDDKSVASIMHKYKIGMYDSDLEQKLSETYAVLKWYCQDHGIETPAADDWKDVIHIQGSSEFSQWWNDVALPKIGMDPEEKMYAGNTRMGRPRWIPLTLENVVKAMTKKVRNGEGFNYGIGNIRSMKAVQFKSIAQIQSQRDHIVSAEDMKALKKEIQDEFSELCDRMRAASRSNYGWEFNTGEDCLMAMAEGGRENAEYLHDRFGNNQELFREMAKFLDKLVNMPTEYFEAKPQRAVGLEEFKAAVIPENTPDDVRKMLEDAGVMLCTYGERQDRKAALQMATRDNDLRFSMGEPDENTARLVSQMQIIAGENLSEPGETYAEKFKKVYGVDLDPKEAKIIAAMAVDENRKEYFRRYRKNAIQFYRESDPAFDFFLNFAGPEGKLNPGRDHLGEEFTGTYISEAYRKYSIGKKDHKTDKGRKNYQLRRENALQNAEGTPLDEVAKAYAEHIGIDPDEAANRILESLRHLNYNEIRSAYSEFRQESFAGSRESARAAKEEFMRQEKYRIENEVTDLLEKGRPISEEWIRENRKVYNELYKQLFPERTAPYSPGKKELEAINAALMQEGANASTYAEAYKVAREKAWEEFSGKLREIKEALNDAVKLQREAISFAEKQLPPEDRGEFIRAIVGLLEVPPKRRQREFDRILENMTRQGNERRKSRDLEKIREMLDAVKIRRNYKGIPTSVLPEEQARVDRIRQVIDMSLPTLMNAIEYNNTRIMALEDDPENGYLADKYREDNALLEMFGNLSGKDADAADQAAAVLDKIIKGGKANFRAAIDARKKEIDRMRVRAVDDATFGKNEFADRGDAGKHTDFMLKNEALGTLLRIASGKSIQDFDNSIGGELYRKVETSTQAEATALRKLQSDFDAALERLAGIKGNALEKMRQKGKFFRMISKVEEHTGVFKIQYGRSIRLGAADYVFEQGRRNLQKKMIPVEDYEFAGKVRKGARSILRDIDNGIPHPAWNGMPLGDMAVAFLRQQLADFDTGMKQAYTVFNDEADDAAFNALLEEERSKGKLLLFTHAPNEEQSTVEVPLSQGAALQILLTWEQDHYKPNMKWNGWTEESIRQLKKFIKPEVLAMGEFMRDYIRSRRDALDDAAFARYGAHLPFVENYFPTAFRGGNAKNVNQESELGRGAGNLTINPSFLIARKFHLKPVDTDADCFSVFLRNQIDQNHFLAWSDTVRDLKAVYGSSIVQKAIADNFGRSVADNIVERIAAIARGGGTLSNDYTTRLLQKFYRHWVPAKIAINVSSIIKQMCGAASYMNAIPVREFCRYYARANFSNPAYREFCRMALASDYLKNRMSGGLDRDLGYLLNYTRDSKAYSAFSDALLNVGTLGTRWADKFSVLHGGYAVYQYAYENARAAGLSEIKAKEAARHAWERASDETQQSGYLKDLNAFQVNQGAFRYLTAFLSNPIQIMNLELRTFNELRYGKDKGAAGKKLARQILVNHLIVPTLMQFTTDMIRHGFSLGDWWDEAEFEDYFLAWAMGPFEGLFLAGKCLNNLATFALDRALGRRRRWQSLSALPLLDDIAGDIDLLVKAADADDFSEKELAGAVKMAGDLLMSASVAAPQTGAFGGMLHAIGVQGRRLARLLDPETDRGRRRR